MPDDMDDRNRAPAPAEHLDDLDDGRPAIPLAGLVDQVLADLIDKAQARRAA